jgi:hypothetical protein
LSAISTKNGTVIEIGALLFGTAFFGGNLANTLLGGVLSGVAYDAAKGFYSLRERLLKPSPQSHDLQKALLQVLENGVQTATNRHLQGLSLTEQQSIEAWKKQVIQISNHQTNQPSPQRAWNPSLATQLL